MPHNVMISEELFRNLVMYFFADDTSVEEQIKTALESKVERMAAHQTYTKEHTNGKNQTNT